MRVKKSVVAVAAALACVAGLATAQGLPEPMVEAARQAIVSNPEVQARWHNFLAADSEIGVARAGYRPQVDLSASIGREWRERPTTGKSEYTHNGAAININQMLFDGFYTSSEVKRLSYAKLTRYYELVEVSEEVALSAFQAYADVARYTQLVEEATNNYVEHKLTSQQLDERATAGVSRRVDLEQANGRLALAESNLLSEISNLHDVSARYLRVMGVVPPGKVLPLSETLKLAGIPDTVLAAMNEGLPNSPTINAAYENVRSAKAQVESRKAAYWPKIELRARKSWDDNLDGVLGNSRDTVIEVVLNHNLYRGGADMAREMEALEFQNQARDLQEKACRDVRQTLAIAYNDVKRLTEQLGYLDQHRLSTEKAREAYRQQFEIGQRTLLDLLDTQNEYFEASRAYTNARYNQVIAQARTLSSMGKLLGALSVGRPDMPTLADVGQDREGPLDPKELCPFDAPEAKVVDKAKLVEAAPPAPRPAPAPAPSKVTLSADALFDFDKSVLKPNGKKALDELYDQIKDLTIEVVVAVGHTDWIGSDAYNMRLSLARANSVKAYLVNKGVAPDRIRAEGKGESEPVADNKTRDGRALNRRVEVEVIQAAPR